MGNDTTENIRREMVRELNAEPKGRAELELKHGQVWDTEELGRDFEVMGFLAPLRGGAKAERRSCWKPHVPA